MDKTKTKKQKQEEMGLSTRLVDTLRLVASMVKEIEKMENFGVVLASVKACETVAGAMTEYANYGKKKMEEANKMLNMDGYTAIRDFMRLCRMVNDLVDMKNNLVQSPNVEWDKLVDCL